ncbi:MAG: hypothetical protein ABEI96_03265 [Haloarculaceae archaeon]
MSDGTPPDGEDRSPEDDGPLGGDGHSHERPSPLTASESGLVSREYRPRTHGPELVTSWPLGRPPVGRGNETAWSITTSEYVTVQRTRLTLPYLGALDRAPLYLNVVGHATVADGATLSLWLEQDHLDGEHYELEADVRRSGHFQLPMVEVVPDGPEDYVGGHDVYGGFTLRARVAGGIARLDGGTAVQLWSE